ncbi:hypothetical protein BG004_000062 [Podila humilis]|nr:hypothetical protein BG004_000062 [Podila humilis]
MSQFPSSLWRPWGLVGTSSITYAFSPSPPPPPLLTIFKSPRPSLVLFLAVTTPLLLFLQTCSAIDFQPITYATCAVLGTRLYVIGGQTDILVSSSYTSQVATISLTDSFDGDHPPWDFMFSSFATARAPGVEARDQRRIILGGNVNNGNHAPAIAFDTNTQSWIQAPDLPGSGVGGGGATSRMQNYTRIGSGLAMDISNGVLIEFGGANATGPTNELNILETSRSTSDPAVGIAMSWYYSGVLSNVPGLYAPIVLYLPNLRMTLIMGGCDQMDLLGNPTSCVKFDKVYTLASESVTSIVPTAKQISTTAGEEIQNEEDGTINNNNTATTIANIPQPRVWSCAVVMKDGNVLMVGGGDPTSPLADSWRLDVTTWKWYRQPIENFPVEGIMGHGCEMAARGQVIVIGGHHGDRFVDRPISIIQLEDWSWTDKFEVSGFSTGIKIGLSLSIVVVVGAIVAGLGLLRLRNPSFTIMDGTGVVQDARDGSTTITIANKRWMVRNEVKVKVMVKAKNQGVRVGDNLLGTDYQDIPGLQ